MSKTTSIVLDNESKGFARIVTRRSTACGGCDSNSAHCHGCMTTPEMISVAANPVGAKPGDIVKVELDSRDMYKGAMVLYLLPILMLLAGAILGMAMGPILGLSDTAAAIAGGLIGFILGIVPVKLLDKSNWAKRKLLPEIKAIVSSSNKPATPVK